MTSATRTPVASSARKTWRAISEPSDSLVEAKESLLKSAVFPDAGYAMLRAKNTDLSVILKFGPHGGGHGHYDKLGEIVYAEGRTQAVDPGTQLYGMALHKEWDQMSVAHNTITVDELRQDQATGKLVAWKDGDNYVAVTASAGPAYKFAVLKNHRVKRLG